VTAGGNGGATIATLIGCAIHAFPSELLMSRKIEATHKRPQLQLA
jgi:hypothetical protein